MLRDQERANSAYTQIKNYQELKPEYVSLSRSIGSLIQSAGLLQAIEFLNSRKDTTEKGKAAKELLNDLAKTVLFPNYTTKTSEANVTKKDYILEIRGADFNKYLFLTRETLAACKWYRRYAESINDDNTSNNDDSINDDNTSKEAEAKE